MKGIRGLVCLARHVVPAGDVRTVTTRTDLDVTLWVESGVVEVLDGLAKGASPRAVVEGPVAVPLARHAIHLRARGKGQVVAIAAMIVGAAEDDGGGDATSARQMIARLLPAERMSHITSAELVATGYVGYCEDHKRVLDASPGPYETALATCASHIKKFPGHRAEPIEADER